MDRRRLIVIGFAALAAIVAIFLMRALLGAGTPKVIAETAPKVVTTQVLVAASALSPGTKLTPDLVRWQNWPKTSVDPSFLTHQAVADLGKYMNDAVVRSPLVVGQPITNTNVVHSSSAGFMAATVSPGMRAVSVPISAETGAGGFILPNDRVDVMLTEQVSSSPRRYRARAILKNIRVLSVDQTAKQEKGQTYVIGKTATLELTPRQAQQVAGASASGTLSLALRSLASQQPPSHDAALAGENDDGAGMSIIRYGVAHVATAQQGE